MPKKEGVPTGLTSAERARADLVRQRIAPSLPADNKTREAVIIYLPHILHANDVTQDSLEQASKAIGQVFEKETMDAEHQAEYILGIAGALEAFENGVRTPFFDQVKRFSELGTDQVDAVVKNMIKIMTDQQNLADRALGAIPFTNANRAKELAKGLIQQNPFLTEKSKQAIENMLAIANGDMKKRVDSANTLLDKETGKAKGAADGWNSAVATAADTKAALLKAREKIHSATDSAKTLPEQIVTASTSGELESIKATAGVTTEEAKSGLEESKKLSKQTGADVGVAISKGIYFAAQTERANEIGDTVQMEEIARRVIYSDVVSILAFYFSLYTQMHLQIMGRAVYTEVYRMFDRLNTRVAVTRAGRRGEFDESPVKEIPTPAE